MQARTALPNGYVLSSRLLGWMLQLFVFAVSGALAFLLRFEFHLPAYETRQLAFAIAVWVVGKALVFRLLSLDGRVSSHASIADLLRIALGNAIGSAACAAVIASFSAGFPRSIYFIDFIVCLQLTALHGLARRLIADAILRARRPRDAKRVVIYGAGAAGVALLEELRTNHRLKYCVVGFIDDDPLKDGMHVQGLPVLGTGTNLPRVAAKHHPDEILIAVPSAGGPAMTRILEQCHSAGLPRKTIPGLADIIEDSGLAAQIREVAVEDLLGRRPIRLEQDAIRARLADEVVLVTGAGGSIGSEICRQVARFHPAAIIGFEMAETPLFQVEQDIHVLCPGTRFACEIGSIQSPARLAEVFKCHRPSVVFHAAAYKHVPMMEAHLVQAVENNVFGTWNVAVAAAEYGVRDFVMISSDKAVGPTNIMGLTKRVAELVVRSFQNGGPNFVSVRFGNVLGSNGSVIPTFKKQIAAGGPVTVTHPEMRRFFMTIPEAVHLVLEALTMGKGGEIFVLDMGQPVKIVDLARNLILLSGLRPDDDIRIEFTGVRPGEKLYEELNAYDENTLPTCHEKIKVFSGSSVSSENLVAALQRCRQYCASRDARRLILELKDLVPEYNPSSHILRELLAENLEKPVAPVRPLTRAAGASGIWG
jgi:FlaA1/EpsC-like NDP-sugar epimerase